MTNLGSLVRLCLVSAGTLSAAVGVVLVTAPSPITKALELGPVEPVHFSTAFGIAVLTTTAALLLRPSHGVHYQNVRFHDPVEVCRPAPARLRPKVGQKVRRKVRDAAAQRVMQQRGR